MLVAFNKIVPADFSHVDKTVKLNVELAVVVPPLTLQLGKLLDLDQLPFHPRSGVYAVVGRKPVSVTV
jgi:hypothetical protein